MPGLLVIIINVAAYFYDEKDVTSRITREIQAMIGGNTAEDVGALLKKQTTQKGTVFHPS